MEYYDPMLVCNYKGYSYTIQNNFNKITKSIAPMMVYLNDKDFVQTEFYGTFYECLDFCEKHAESVA